MDSLFPFIVAGATAGSVYGMAGVGLVLTYKTSGIFNFAHGALATVAAYAFYTLHVQHGVPWPIAAAICLLVLGPALGFGFESFARGIARAALVWRVVATIGVLLVIEAGCTLIYGAPSRPFPHYLSTSTFQVLSANVTYESLIVVIVSVLATAGLYVFFRVGRTGMAMRAVVDDPDLLALSGTSPARVRRAAWVIGCTFAVLSGLLLAPSIDLDATSLTLLVVQAFGAAAIGRFSSLPLTWVGGVVIGIAASLLTKYLTAGSILGGLPPSLPFALLFVVLVVSPRVRLAVRDVGLTRRVVPWSVPGRIQLIAGVVVLAFLVAVPELVGFRLIQWTIGLTAVILFLSLGLLTRTSGQVSLCHAGFAAIGAVAFSKLTTEHHVPWLLALILSALIVVPVGALVSIPAIRLSGLYLALATFGFGLLLQNMFYQSSWMFGANSAGIPVPLPHLGWLTVDSDRGFYYVVLAVTVLTAVFVVWLTRSRLGRLLRALADSPTALVTSGTSVIALRVMVFCVSAFIAGLSGGLMGSALGYVSGANFDPILSLTYLSLIMITAGGAPWSALVAGLGLTLVPSYFTSPDTSYWLELIFGVSAVVIALRGQPELPERVRRTLDRLGGRARRAPLASAAQAPTPEHRVEPAELQVQDLSVRFGGLVAVDGLSLQAQAGRITGLIGPNGAGKTTTFDACSGLNRHVDGTVSFGGREISRFGPAGRARRGLGRTFQEPELFDSMTVRENVALGCEAAIAGSNPLRQVWSGPRQRALTAERAEAALRSCGLVEIADRDVASLSTGQRRLVELARALAGPYRFLLLDEPSAGLDREETRRFGEVLTRVTDERGLGILLVEHDMALVMDICSDIYVLDFGELLFHGTPPEVQASETVRAAYLGADVGAVAVIDKPRRPDVRLMEKP